MRFDAELPDPLSFCNLVSSLDLLSSPRFSVTKGGVADRGGVVTGGVLKAFVALDIFVLEYEDPAISSLAGMIADGCCGELSREDMILAAPKQSQDPTASASCANAQNQSSLSIWISAGILQCSFRFRVVSSQIDVDSSCPATCYRF